MLRSVLVHSAVPLFRFATISRPRVAAKPRLSTAKLNKSTAVAPVKSSAPVTQTNNPNQNAVAPPQPPQQQQALEPQQSSGGSFFDALKEGFAWSIGSSLASRAMGQHIWSLSASDLFEQTPYLAQERSSMSTNNHL